MSDPPARMRRPPPAFRPLAVTRRERRTPYLTRITLAGPELAGYEPPLPAGSVRLLLPDEPGADLVIPEWNGNAFFHADGRRPVIRTLTPLRHDADTDELDIDVVLHGAGPLSEWASSCEPGDPVAISGPGRGFAIDPEATYVLAGDESAIPAIGQLLEALPAAAEAAVIVEVTHPQARLPITDRAEVEVRWVDLAPGDPPGAAMVGALVDVAITPDTRLWVAGEAAAVQRIRRHLFGELGLGRSRAHVRGYWKHGRSGDDSDDR